MEDSSDTLSDIFKKPTSVSLIQEQSQTSESQESLTSKDNTVSSVNDSSNALSQIFQRAEVCLATSIDSPGLENSSITRLTSDQNVDTDDTVVVKKKKFAFNRQIDTNSSNLFADTPSFLSESVIGEPTRKKKCFKSVARNETFLAPQFSVCDMTESSVLLPKKQVKLATTSSSTNSKSLPSFEKTESNVIYSQTFVQTHNLSVNTTRTAESSVILKKKKSAFKKLQQSRDVNMFDSEPDSICELTIKTKEKMKRFRDDLSHEQSLLHELSKLSDITDNTEGVSRKRIALFGGKENVGVNFDCTISSIGDSVTEKRLDGALSKFKKYGNSKGDESSDLFGTPDYLINESECKASELEVSQSSGEDRTLSNSISEVEQSNSLSRKEESTNKSFSLSLKESNADEENESQSEKEDFTLVVTESSEQNLETTRDRSVNKSATFQEPSTLNGDINESSVDKFVLTLELESSERQKSVESFIREKAYAEKALSKFDNQSIVNDNAGENKSLEPTIVEVTSILKSVSEDENASRYMENIQLLVVEKSTEYLDENIIVSMREEPIGQIEATDLPVEDEQVNEDIQLSTGGDPADEIGNVRQLAVEEAFRTAENIQLSVEELTSEVSVEMNRSKIIKSTSLSVVDRTFENAENIQLSCEEPPVEVSVEKNRSKIIEHISLPLVVDEASEKAGNIQFPVEEAPEEVSTEKNRTTVIGNTSLSIVDGASEKVENIQPHSADESKANADDFQLSLEGNPAADFKSIEPGAVEEASQNAEDTQIQQEKQPTHNAENLILDSEKNIEDMHQSVGIELDRICLLEVRKKKRIPPPSPNYEVLNENAENLHHSPTKEAPITEIESHQVNPLNQLSIQNSISGNEGVDVVCKSISSTQTVSEAPAQHLQKSFINQREIVQRDHSLGSLLVEGTQPLEHVPTEQSSILSKSLTDEDNASKNVTFDDNDFSLTMEHGTDQTLMEKNLSHASHLPRLSLNDNEVKNRINDETRVLHSATFTASSSCVLGNQNNTYTVHEPIIVKDGDRNSQTLSSIFHRPQAFGRSQNEPNASTFNSQNSTDVEEAKNRTYTIQKTLEDESSLMLIKKKPVFQRLTEEDDLNMFSINSNLLSETVTIERRVTRASARLSALSAKLDESVPSQLRDSRGSTTKNTSNASGRKSLRNSKRSSIAEDQAQKSEKDEQLPTGNFRELDPMTESLPSDESRHKNNLSRAAEPSQPEEKLLSREESVIERGSQSKAESEPEEDSQQMDESEPEEEEEEESQQEEEESQQEEEESQPIDYSESEEGSEPAEESEPEEEESQPAQDSLPREDESQSEEDDAIEPVENSLSEKTSSQSAEPSRVRGDELVAMENQAVVENESMAIDTSHPVNEPPLTVDEVPPESDELLLSADDEEERSELQPSAVETNGEIQMTVENEFVGSRISEEDEGNGEELQASDEKAQKNDAESAGSEVEEEEISDSSIFKRPDSMYFPRNRSKMASISLSSSQRRSVSFSQGPDCTQFTTGQLSSRSKTQTTDSSVSLVRKMCDDKSSVLLAAVKTHPIKSAAAASKKKRKPQNFDFDSDDDLENSVDVLPKKPNFPEFHPYCGKRFYSRIIAKMAPKYGVKTNSEAVRLAEYVWKSVKHVQNCNDAAAINDKVDEMKRTLYRKQVVVTHADFYWFCVRNLPVTFNHKAVPMALVRSPVVFDISKAFDPILDES